MQKYLEYQGHRVLSWEDTPISTILTVLLEEKELDKSKLSLPDWATQCPKCLDFNQYSVVDSTTNTHSIYCPFCHIRWKYVTVFEWDKIKKKGGIDAQVT